jgi:hypothetical protein
MEKLEDLRFKIIEKGQRDKDKRKINEFVDYTCLSEMSDNFLTQVVRDIYSNYRFYDALAMWIGQKEYWEKEDILVIEKLVEMYLEKTI